MTGVHYIGLGMATLFTAYCQASELEVRAEFIPRVTSPSNMRFVNTTPVTGYCAVHANHCRPNDVTLVFPLSIDRQWVVPGPIEGHNYQRVDGGWKSVAVTHDRSPTSVALRFRLDLLARRYQRGVLAPGGKAAGIANVGNSSGASGASSGGCVGRTGNGTATVYDFAWTVPAAWKTCTRGPKAGSMGPYAGRVDQVSIGYQLEAPDPFALGNGTYSGRLTYTLGPGQQIDLGTGRYDESEVTFNFVLTVQHELRVDFPAGSHRAVLEPDGGWARWQDSSQVPTRLRRVHPFQIWTSLPMKMYLKCDSPINSQCSIREPVSGHAVPIAVAVTLPGDIHHNGNPVKEMPLPLGENRALAFQSVAITKGRPGQLHYSVQAPHVAAMMKNTGRQYSGDVTIVFDAQL